MEQHFEKNIEKIVGNVESVFVEKINPFIEKSIKDQKDKLIKNILSQVKIDLVKEMHGQEVTDSSEVTPQGFEIEKHENRYYRYRLKKDSPYNHSDMKQIMAVFNSDIQKGVVFSNSILLYMNKFISVMLTDEYLCEVFFRNDYRGFLDSVLLITNFGSHFVCTGSDKWAQKNYDTEIPKDILTIFINILIKPLGKEFSLENFYPGNFDYVSFGRSIEAFRKYWMARPFSGYSAELLKKENESIKKTAEKMKEDQDKKMEEAKNELDKKLEESKIEQEKIKHMYETLELKDQYHKAVELLRQNKVERDLLDQDRREFYAEREATKFDLEEKTKKYRQIKDIDTEISRLALMKQKLEKDRRAFEKEKEEFEDLRDSLMNA